MRIDIITTFVEMFRGPFDESIIKRAIEAGLIDIRLRNLREWSTDKHHKTDDEQYGGGDGMVMLARPLINCIREIINETEDESHIVLTTPKGQQFSQTIAEEYSTKKHIIIVCGHYKGIDQRVLDYFQMDELSIGDYVLTGGELPAMVITDAVVRLIPGVVGSQGSVMEDSFTSGLLDCPRYTRPQEIDGMKVPDVLMSGNHKKINQWRLEKSKEITAVRRPDLYQKFLEENRNQEEQ